jgi:hypothetical protein
MADNFNDDVPELAYNPVLVLRKAAKVRSNAHAPAPFQREAVEECIGLGLTHDQVAKVMGISLGTLKRHYKDELELGRITKVAALSRTMFEIGTDKTHKGVVAAGMYLLKTQGGEQYRETTRTELTGKDGKPLQIDNRSNTVDPKLLSHEQRDALRDILTSAMKLAAPVQSQPQEDDEPIDGEYSEVDTEIESED